ncbi:MAG: hypothetical protein RMY36_021705 [Nostoc sp. SerVER01]|nr:hypothetical protein [Nostoc sp. DcaGUA01]
MRDNNSTTKRPTSSCSYFGNGIADLTQLLRVRSPTSPPIRFG